MRFIAAGTGAWAQLDLQPQIQNYRLPGFDGLNIFEDPKDLNTTFDGLKVRVGGDFAMQWQAISHSTELQIDSNFTGLKTLGNNFNLPTANLNLDVQLADGMRMHLRTYLSSRHHVEAWVKGGHIQIDKLDFIKEGLGERFMRITSIRIGLDEINYGDAHFRRTDNARAIYNPFVGNYIMDAFTTEAFGEILIRPSDWIIMLGISNGNLNQSVDIGTRENQVSLYAKLGWDSQINEDLRIRLTGSVYNSPGYDNGGWLYGGDRAGSRYYHVMEENGTENDFSGRFNPRLRKFTAYQINPFIKFQGLEFFGIFELQAGDRADADGMRGGSYTQLGSELIYRFGSWNQFYVGARYNSVSGEASEGAAQQNITRVNGGFGWFMTKNVLIKIEYVNQDYEGEGFTGTVFQEGNFNGGVFEAVIGF